MLPLDVIYQGDCLELLQQIPDESIDVTFADPPFNLKKAYHSYQDRVTQEAYLMWCQQWLTHLVRITKPTGSIFVHNIPKWLTHYAAFLNQSATFRHWIAWDAMGSPLGRSLLPNHYGILYYVKQHKQTKFYDLRYPHLRARKTGMLLKDYGGKKANLHPFGPLASDIWTDLHRIRHAKHRDQHPCQLPIPLLERLLLMSSDEGDVILDPFAGTGTSLVAAKRLGRHYIGMELDPHYVQIAQDNLQFYGAPSQLHGVWVSVSSGRIVTLRDCDWQTLAPHFIIPDPPQALEHTPIQYRHGKLR